MKSAGKATKRPPSFPALTREQRAWIASRRRELKSAIDEGLKSGKAEGYRAFDADRLLSFIEQDRKKRASSKSA